MGCGASTKPTEGVTVAEPVVTADTTAEATAENTAESAGETNTADVVLDVAAVHSLVPSGVNAKYQTEGNPDGKKPLFTVTLVYDFQTVEDCVAFIDGYVQAEDAPFSMNTSTAEGVVVAKVLKGLVKPKTQDDENATEATTAAAEIDPNRTKVLEYQEWTSEECYLKWIASMLSIWQKYMGLVDAETNAVIDADDFMKNPLKYQWLKLKDNGTQSPTTHWSGWSCLAKSDRSGDKEMFPDGPGYCCTIVYEWKEKKDYHAWLQNFCHGDDGHFATAESEGCRVANLIVGKGDGGNLKCGFYEEWDSQAKQFAYAGVRVKAGFMQKWFDLDLTTFKWPKLQNENAVIQGWELVKQGP